MKTVVKTVLVVAAIVAMVVVAAHSFDVIGMLRRMHGH
jgi:hypothetical protein